MASDDINLLVIVVDVNPIWWGQQAQCETELTLSKCLDAVMVLGNSHMAIHFLYPGKSWGAGDSCEEDASSSGDGKYELLSVANNFIAEEIRKLIAKILTESQKIMKVIKAAEDCALQYMNFMNVIFASQKQNILIDACVLDSDSGLLQQACDITGGLYLKIPQKVALAQYLLWVFLPDCEQRAQLVLPPPVHVDYRAACFCHRNLIEIGYVCSVCLSIFCNFSPICTTCETAFKIQLPQMVKPKKKKLKQQT
ncbi:hypothetical protein F7725_012900 [Dissostichus mawsoni]|uniref:General transcription factor IIH subunit 3 n=1 Tax=Dissostichus mawsoni TaxID=36200 RepID=A0A7J5YS74_DISMA|nr:hypothetical protein F7725_012900 [Dissostichus mawsoni]